MEHPAAFMDMLNALLRMGLASGKRYLLFKK